MHHRASGVFKLLIIERSNENLILSPKLTILKHLNVLYCTYSRIVIYIKRCSYLNTITFLLLPGCCISIIPPPKSDGNVYKYANNNNL